MWAQVVGSNKPTVERGLLCNGEQIYHPGMLDTGPDMTIVAHSEWLANWELQPAAGVISGIGGADGQCLCGASRISLSKAPKAR